MSEYRNLNINRESLKANIEKFIEANGLQLEPLNETPNKLRVEFGSPGADFAMVDIHLNNTGTTTIQWKIGKNHSLGEKLAQFLKNTIDPEEFEQVNCSLNGITKDSFDSIVELIAEFEDIEISVHRDNEHCKQVAIKSTIYQDQLTLTCHLGTRKLQVQGRPLSCYRRVVYLLTDLLDLKGLEQVLYRKDDSSAEIVRTEMAEDYLKAAFSKSYDHLPESVKKLLMSGCCIRLASPQLPDYCLLLYPDLRALEGVLKELMSGYDMSIEDSDNGFSDFFDVVNGVATLKPSYSSRIAHAKMEKAFNEGYAFYRKHRHTLFHMEEFADVSRMVDTLEKAISISKDAYTAIDGLYTARM